MIMESQIYNSNCILIKIEERQVQFSIKGCTYRLEHKISISTNKDMSLTQSYSYTKLKV